MQEGFFDQLYIWYAANQRKLPWRETNNPYLIWISEIILQQTRVTQGLPYYMRFIQRFPNVKSLAEAPEDELMKIWEGLGYYSRARNLHTAAKSILKNYEGVFPRDYLSIRQLKGTGDYTAAAVASIAFGLPYAVVDGNVMRVLSRYFKADVPIDTTSGKKYFKSLANEILLTGNPGMHNQALMELGALVCVPQNPDCSNCPLNMTCKAFAGKTIRKFPVKGKSRQKAIRYFTYILIESPNHIVIEKRSKQDIWKNLYQLPLIETDRQFDDHELLTHSDIESLILDTDGVVAGISPVFVHILTHRKILARFVHIKCNKITFSNSYFILIDKEEISKFAFPVLITRFLKKTGFL